MILIFWNGNFFLLQDRGEEEEKKLTNILIFMSKRKTMDAKLLYHYTTCNLKTLKHKFNILNHFDYFLIEFSLKTNFFCEVSRIFSSFTCLVLNWDKSSCEGFSEISENDLTPGVEHFFYIGLYLREREKFKIPEIWGKFNYTP